MKPSAIRIVQRIRLTIRDAWLILGLTVLLFVLVEAVYRLQATGRRALRGERPSRASIFDPGHPNAHEVWWTDVIHSGALNIELRYDPFRGWWPKPRRSTHVNIDSQGHRLTIQHDDTSEGAQPVYLLGGSSMWGWIVRDSFTVASLVAARLAALGYRNVIVTNLAQSTFDLAQNTATLSRELRFGRVPAVAVFLDGNNEAAPVFQSGRLGTILNQDIIARRFERKPGLAADAMSLLQQSALVQRLTQRNTSPAHENPLSLCPDIAASYARQTSQIRALAEQFDFKALFLWQPLLATTRKDRTPWERSAIGSPEWEQMLTRCTAAVNVEMAARREVQFYSLDSLFDNHKETVFTDAFGHVTEAGNRVIAGRIVDLILPALRAP